MNSSSFSYLSDGIQHQPNCKPMNQQVTVSPRRCRRRMRHKAPPATPHIQWNYATAALPGGGGGGVEVSARKLAAGLWQLRLAAEIYGGFHGGLNCGSCEPGVGHQKTMSPHHHITEEFGVKLKDLSQSPRSVSAQKNNIVCKVGSPFPHPESAKEGVLKLDLKCSKTSNEARYVYKHPKLFEDQVSVSSIVSALQAELKRAQLRIQKLEAKRRSSKKKLKDLLRKLVEERTLWRAREHQRIRVVVDVLKNELDKEKKICQRMEILNSKLVRELADVNLHVKQFMQDYEEQKRARELMEEVCNELAKKIGEDKAEFEALKRESIKIHEEVEEERRMLQLAEIWREERVQMKLVDAKLALEDRYSQMNELVHDLKSFLRSKSATLDAMDLRKAELINQMVKSVNTQDMKEFTYEPSKSVDIFSIVEEIQQCEAYKTKIEPCVNNSPVVNSPKLHPVSPEANDIASEPSLKQLNGCLDYSSDLVEDALGSETVTHAEHQGSSYCLEGRNLSISWASKNKKASRNGAEEKENVVDDCSSTQISEEVSEVCPASAEQSKQKASFASKLWTSCLSERSFYENPPVEEDRRLSNGTVSSLGTISPIRNSCEGLLKHHNSAGQCLPDSVNPHITRAMNGCIEWPRVVQKNTLQNTLKTKLLEAKMESQKAQLRTVLKRRS